MRIFVAGASGALGRQLVPLLAGAGHEVVGTTTSPQKRETLRALGAEPVVLDVLDAEAVGQAVSEVAPDVVVHQATALAAVAANLRKFDEAFAQTNRLRTEGTDNLLAAAKAVDVQKFVAQSYAGWPYARQGAAIKDENDLLDPNPASNGRQTMAAIRHLEEAVVAANGTVLRYGGFYGPGTSLAEGGEMLEPLRRRLFPVVGSGGGIASFVHIEDAARGTMLAIERGEPGLYNIVDGRSGADVGVASVPGGRRRREASASCPALARQAHGGRAARDDDDGGPRRLEREGEARARLEAGVSELAGRLRQRAGRRRDDRASTERGIGRAP